MVALAGELDVAAVPKLAAVLDQLILDGTSRILVDLEGVDFIDSSGLRALVATLRRLEADGGSLHLVRPGPRILKVLTIAGLTSLFTILDPPDSAVADQGS